MRRTTPLAAPLAAPLALALAATIPVAVRAQSLDIPVTIGQRATVHSAILDENRPVLVHLPRSYEAAGIGRYPVLYLLDGDSHFASVSAMADFLARNGRIPELIVVAIPNTKDRTHDLTPPLDTAVVRVVSAVRDTVTNRYPTAGGAPEFRGFLADELTRWVETRYRTAPYRVLVGHSFGGLFALDVLAATPRTFNAYIAISPSLWWDDGKYERRLESTLAHAPLGGLTLYMSTGGREGALMIDPARALATAIDAQHVADFRASYRVMPTETHNSNPLRTTYDGLEQIFAGWEAPDSVTRAATLNSDLTGLDAHNAALTRQFGYPIATSTEQVNNAAYAALRAKRIDAAVTLFQRNVTSAPGWPSGWDSLAEGLEAQHKLADALAAQEKAVRLGDASKDPLLPTFRAHLARLRKASVGH